MKKFSIEDLSVRYSDQNESLRHVNMEIEANAITVLFGPAGGGKSTFLRVLNRLNDLADVDEMTGKVMFNGMNILDKETDVIELRRKIGMVFSRPVPLPLSIYENVAYGLRVNGVRDRDFIDARVEESLKLAALWDEVKDRLDQSGLSLSGGQQQRLCIARAMAVEPEVLLMDEPASALDPIATQKIEELIHELKSRFTIVIVTHSMQQAARVSDRTAFFYMGRLIEVGPTDKLFTRPENKQTEDYITGRFG